MNTRTTRTPILLDTTAFKEEDESLVELNMALQKYKSDICLILWTSQSISEQQEFLKRCITQSIILLPTYLFDGNDFIHPTEVYNANGWGMNGNPWNYLYRLQECTNDLLKVIYIWERDISPQTDNIKYRETDRFKKMKELRIYSISPSTWSIEEALSRVLEDA